MDVIGPDGHLSAAIQSQSLPPDWYAEGAMTSTSLTVTDFDGLPALFVSPGPHSFTALRRVRAQLLAMPYLTWVWRGRMPQSGSHPVRLVIGLSTPEGRSQTSWLFPKRNAIERVDRLIEIEWSDSALKRGSVTGPFDVSDTISSGRYVARGGPEQGYEWRQDSVDIATLQAQIWPADDTAGTEVRYIGLRALPGPKDATMAISSVRLTR